MAAQKEVIPFDEIVPSSSVRVAVVDGVQYLSIRDIVMVMCEKNGHDANQIWRRISEDLRNEVGTFCSHLKFKGTGQREQPVIQFQGALKLLMWLPGDKAKAFRSKAAEILTRYYAGDKTLLNDVWANAQSNEPINEAARAALPQLDVLEEYSSKRQKIMEHIEEDLALVKVMAAVTRDYNTHLKEQLLIKREMFGMELDHGKAMFSVADMGRKSEFEHKKALKALDDAPPVAAASDPATHTTVLKVFTRHRDQFSGFATKNKRDKFLKSAGMKAAASFRAHWGREPAKTAEGEFEVCEYPLEADGLILDAIRAAYRDNRAGSGQAAIHGYLLVPQLV